MSPVTDEWAAKCRRHADALIEPLRAVAREHGYALAVHGSLRRDIDLIAVPWAEDAVPAVELAESIRAEADRIAGYAEYHPDERDDYFRSGRPLSKPHGRLGFVFLLPGGPMIDLSVMQPWGKSQDAAYLKAVTSRLSND